MEEEKAAAYYDELTRKGEGAARFKQGLGFSSSETTNPPLKGSALPSSSSFLSTFVKASALIQSSEVEAQPHHESSKFQRQSQLESIQNKLKKKPSSSSKDERSRVSEKRHRSRSRERDRGRYLSSRSRSRDRYRDREKRRDGDGDRDRETERRRRRRRSRSRSRSVSPHREKRRTEKKSTAGNVDYSRLIDGYDKMSGAERVKAKMKLQLAETAEKDAKEGMGAGWERFEFNKDAPLDDEEIEAAEDDAVLVKHIGQSFRFSTVEAKREEQIKAAHDEAMFGAPVLLPVSVSSAIMDSEPEVEEKEKEKASEDNSTSTSLLSEKVRAKQQGSWRDRARKL